MARRVLGASRRWVRRTLDRAMHPTRQQAALARLRALGPVERVLFVCHGNIYRSPYAEAAFRAALPTSVQERVVALSAGFVGPGRPAPPASIALAGQRGLDLTAHRSQLLTPALVRESHLVVVMSPQQAQEICRRFALPRRRVLVLGDLDPEAISSREVTDPWNRPVQVLEDSTGRVARCVAIMVGVLYGSSEAGAGGAEV
jgi:protein-tyrosine-phosphatase